jgi:LacI family transcriptional regulator
MKQSSRPKIALLVETSRAYGRDLLRGVANFARTFSNWSLLHQELSIDAALPQWVAISNVQGVIARVDIHNIDPLRELQVPIVDVRCSRRFAGVTQVHTDDRAVACLAFEHLWEHGFRRFAFCGFQSAHYSENRLKHFREIVAAAGCPLSVYTTHNHSRLSLSRIEESGITETESLAAWLRTLRPPTGVLVCNDIRGQQILNARRHANVAVPDELAVIGVDDDDAICLLCDPPLSSIHPNAEQVGYRAAELLHRMLCGKPVPESIEYVAPLGVVARSSTLVSAVEDREVARVCQFIREHACDGMKVSDIERFSQLSRRQLERRFREGLNRTLHQEITHVQLLRVKQLLTETKMSLEQIAPLAGYTHKERLYSVFKRETGETPGQYRQRASGSHFRQPLPQPHSLSPRPLDF